MFDPVKIIYVLGSARSGSTFVEHAIAQQCGIAQLGETRLWPKCYMDDHMCSCGKAKTECDFWVPVLEGLETPEKAVHAFDRTMKRSYLSSLFLPSFLNKLVFRGVSDQLLAFYDKIRSTHGRDVLLEGSNNPAYGATLSQTPGLDVVFIHVVRHPLAAVYSCKRQRQKTRDAELYNTRKPLALVALEWTTSNLMCEIAKLRNPLLSIYMRYEKLGNPDQHDMLLNQMELMKSGEDHPPLSHIMSGNPGTAWKETDFELEEEWKTGLSMFEKIIYGAITYPLYVFYIRREA